MALRDSRNAWPFPAVTDASRGGEWTEISEAHADDLLNVLPPVYIPGGFMVGEEVAYDDERGPLFTAVINVGGRRLAQNWPARQRRDAFAAASAALQEAQS